MGDVSSRNQAFFIQDAWSIHLARERSTSACASRTSSFPPSRSFWKGTPTSTRPSPRLRPRTRGHASAGATRSRRASAWPGTSSATRGVKKVYGSFGFFFDTMKYELPRGAPSAATRIFLLTYYTLPNIDLNSIKSRQPARRVP